MSDNLNVYPVHRIEGTKNPTVAHGTIANNCNLYLDPAIYQSGIHGPFNQTLFLGCSIVNFNVNLGWGAENSSLTVSLVNDDSPHWLSNEFQNTNNLIAVQNSIPKINSANLDQPTLANPSQKTFNTLPVSNNTFATTPSENKVIQLNSTDISQKGNDLYANIYLKEEENKLNNLQQNTCLSQASPPRPDYGKVYYDLKEDGTYIKKYWLDKDPGFVGEAFDILGTPVRFIFNDFEFIGIVTSWKNNGGQGGNKLYTVEIKSFASLLDHTQLIIDYYPGTIFTKFNTKPYAFTELEKFGLPSNDIGTRFGRQNSTESQNSDYNADNYIGNINEGNIPNVFNIYGYLETTLGFGKSDINDIGTKIVDVLAGIKDLINYTGLIDTRFSPYGKIIGKAPAITKISGSQDFSIINPNIIFLKDQYKIIDPKECSFSGIIEESIPNAIAPPLSTQKIISYNIKLNELGLLPARTAADGIIRQHYQLDLSELPIPPSGQRIKGPIISVMDLITNICNSANYDFFIDFAPSGNQIKVRTISRQNQPANNYIQQLISSASSGSILTSYDYGKELNDSAGIRSLYIGAKQKRLVQLYSSFLSTKNNGLLYDPYDDGTADVNASNFLFRDTLDLINAVRMPDHLSTRHPKLPLYGIVSSGSSVPGSGTGVMIWEEPREYAWNMGLNCGQGNYNDAVRFEGPNDQAADNRGLIPEGNERGQDLFADLNYTLYSHKLFINKDYTNNGSPIVFNTQYSGDIQPNSKGELTPAPDLKYINYPLWDDFICPYFGLDLDGTARKVYYDTAMQQIQVLCSVGDLQNKMGFSLTSAIDLSNTRIGAWQNTTTIPNNTSVDTGTFPPNNPASNAQAIGNSFGDSLNRFERHLEWNAKNREYYTSNSKFLLTENEIRSAMASFDSWMEYTFNRTFTTDLGQILRMSMLSNTGLIVQEKDGSADSEARRVQLGLDYPVTLVYHGPDPHVVGDTPAENPTTSKAAMMTEKVKNLLTTVHAYVADIGNTYYGKQFMVKIPGLTVSRDRPYTTGTDIKIGYPSQGLVNNNHHFEAERYDGGGKLYTNYKPSTDGAWEEVGNVIDDMIIVGSITGDFFREPDGKIGTILGYKASYEYLNDTIKDEEIKKYPHPAPITPLPNTPVNFVDQDDKPASYTSLPVDAGATGGETVSSLSESINSSIASSAAPPEDTQYVVPTAAMVLAQASQPATGTDIIPNDWYPSVITELSNQEYLYYPYDYNQSSKPLPIQSFIDNGKMKTTAFGKLIPSSISSTGHLYYKIYTKGQLSDNYVFINIDTKSKDEHRSESREPRAIISLSSPVLCNPVHLADQYLYHCLNLDSMIFKRRGCSIPDEIKGSKKVKLVASNKAKTTIADLTATKNNGFVPFQGGLGIGPDFLTLGTDHLVQSLNSSSSMPSENKAMSMPIAPKAAMPGFAAVPLESQGAVYGPWTNHPFLVRKEIFTDIDISTNDNYLKESIENLVGGIKVEVAEDLAPWRFGGMRSLDEEVIARLQNDANYQLQIEYGTVDIPGAPIYRLGEFLDKLGDTTGGPVVNSIQANIDKGGISTKYSFRTFSKKFGLYNKENADRLARINAEGIERRRELAFRAAEIGNRTFQNLRRQNLNGAPNTRYVNPPLVESWRSASELLVGHNEISFRLPQDSKTNPADGSNNYAEAISGVLSKFNYDYDWGFTPSATGIPSGDLYNVLDYPKFIGHSKIMDSREAPKILMGSYEDTSFMSLDGLLSPISFYPTENFRTYHITKYPRSKCRFCLGVGQIEYKTNANKLPGLVGSTRLEETSYANSVSRESRTILCPFCEKDEDKANRLIQGSSRGRVTPPFIVTSGLDPDSDTKGSLGTEGGLTTFKTTSTVINYSTLNPVVLSFGEFSAFQNRQSQDRTGHCIKMVSQGSIPPNGPNDSLNQQLCGDNRLWKSFLEYDQLYLDKVKELYSIPADQRTDTIKKIIENTPENPRPFATNSRFFGLRGPLMLHGWGYDTEGYPVPNASGELQYVTGTNGERINPIVCTGVEDSNYVIKIYKNQKFIEVTDTNDAEGKILVSYEGKQGYWTDPYRETTFAKGWAQTPSTWPVGPVDLRWDANAKIWTIPTTYKNVYVLLEEDLNNNIARGELVDNNVADNNGILALGYRKVVYVRDTLGVFRAPRSAIIYCAYDNDSGYYEPVSQSIFSTSGEIISQNTVSIYKIYNKQSQLLSNNTSTENESVTYTALYTNPLGISVSPGDLAMLSYMQNGWVVQAARG